MKHLKNSKQKASQQVLMESEKVEFQSKKTKKMTAHSYKTQFKPQQQHAKPLVLDTDEAFQGLKAVVNDKVVTDGNCFKESCVKNSISLQREGSTCSERTKYGVVVLENDVKSTGTTLAPESAGDSRHEIRKSVCSVRKRVNSDSTENDLASCGGDVNKGLGRVGTFKRKSQYSTESPLEHNLDKQDLNREPIMERGAESVPSKLPVVEKEIGVKSPSEEPSETDVKISELERNCRKRRKKLQRKQMEKIQEFHKIWDEKREQLNKDLQLEIAFIRSVFSEVSVRTVRLKRLDEAFASKIDKHNLMRDVELKALEAEQLAAMNAEKQKAERWLTAAKTGNSEPIAVYVPPLIDDNARVSHLEINSSVDATTVVSESVELVVDKNACESESPWHCQDQNFKENDSLQHLEDQIPSESESTQHLEDQKPSESVCANGNASAPANTSISPRAYTVHLDRPTEMRNSTEPIPSGNLPPVFDPSTCRAVYVGNIQMEVTEQLLQDVFAITGPVESCKLVRKEMSTYGFVQYVDRRSASLAIQSLNGSHLFGLPIKVNWAYGNGWKADTSSYYNIFVAGLGSEVTDIMLYKFFSVYPSCSYAQVMRDKTTNFPRGFGFVSFRNQQEAQSAIDDLTGKWLGSRQIYCNWATKGANASDDKPNPVAPENNPHCTTVFVGNLAPEVTRIGLHQLFHALGAGSIEQVRIHRDKGFGLVRYSTHAEAALAISMGNKQASLSGIAMKCSWGSQPTPPITGSLFSSDLLAYVRHLAMCKMGDFNALMHPAQGQLPLEQGDSMDGTAASASQVISNGGFQNVAASKSSCATSN